MVCMGLGLPLGARRGMLAVLTAGASGGANGILSVKGLGLLEDNGVTFHSAFLLEDDASSSVFSFVKTLRLL